MSIEELKLNCSTIFLLTGIGLRRKDLLKYGFVSAFIDDVHHDVHYIDSVYLLYKPEDEEMLEQLQGFLASEEKREVGFIEDYDYGGGYTICVYKFPTKFKKEYRLFLEGKYSQFSDEYIKLFPTFTTVKDEKGINTTEYSLQYHIFKRTKSIRNYWEEKVGETLPEDMEMWSKPDKKKETLDIKTLGYGK